MGAGRPRRPCARRPPYSARCGTQPGATQRGHRAVPPASASSPCVPAAETAEPSSATIEPVPSRRRLRRPSRPPRRRRQRSEPKLGDRSVRRERGDRDRTSGPTDEIDRGVQPQIDLAVADLAARLSVDPSTITVVSAAFVVWPDKGLGCPQHGMEYQQVQVDGTLIELEVDGERYRYHSGEVRPPFLCEPTFSANPLGPDESTPDASG